MFLSTHDDDDLKTIVPKPEDKTDPALLADESFSKNSKLHVQRLERQKEKPGLLPRPIANFFGLIMIIAGVIAGAKYMHLKFGEDVTDYLSEALASMREWFTK